MSEGPSVLIFSHDYVQYLLIHTTRLSGMIAMCKFRYKHKKSTKIIVNISNIFIEGMKIRDISSYVIWLHMFLRRKSQISFFNGILFIFGRAGSPLLCVGFSLVAVGGASR